MPSLGKPPASSPFLDSTGKTAMWWRKWFDDVYSRLIGVQGVRVAASIAAGPSTVTVTWPIPFPNTEYTVSVNFERNTAVVGQVTFDHIVSRAEGSVVLALDNFTGAAVDITLHVMGVRD